MKKLQLLSAGLVAATILATPALARENHRKSQHRAEIANASGRGIGEELVEGTIVPRDVYRLEGRRIAVAGLRSRAFIAPASPKVQQRPALHGYSTFSRARISNHSWCLHNYSDDYIDCSYSGRSQCAATASGGLGGCSVN